MFQVLRCVPGILEAHGPCWPWVANKFSMMQVLRLADSSLNTSCSHTDNEAMCMGCNSWLTFTGALALFQAAADLELQLTNFYEHKGQHTGMRSFVSSSCAGYTWEVDDHMSGKVVKVCQLRDAGQWMGRLTGSTCLSAAAQGHQHLLATLLAARVPLSAGV